MQVVGGPWAGLRARAQVDEAWPQLQGGPGHVGAADPSGPPPPLERAWTGGPAEARVSSIVVAGGIAVATASTSVVGLDPTRGTVLWDAPRAAGPLAPPALDPDVGEHGVIVFTEGDSPGNSAVIGLDLSTHARLWRVAIGDLSRGGPTIAPDGVAVVGSRDHFVYAVDVERGTLRWKFRAEASVNVAPAASADRAFVVSENSTTGATRLYSVDVATGRSRWSYSPDRIALGVSSPTIAGDRVVVGFGDQTVRSFDADRGGIAWSEPVRGFFSAPTALAYDGVAVFAVDQSGGVYRFDAGTGTRGWDYQFPSFVSWSSPLVLGGSLLVGMDDGTIATIDRSTGHLTWRTNVSTGLIASFTPVGDRVVTSSLAARRGVVAFAHDPTGPLLDVPSPTQLDLPMSLLNFAGAFAIMFLLLFLLFRFAFRLRRAAGPPTGVVPEPQDVEG